MNPIHEDYQHGRVAAKGKGQSLGCQSPGCTFNTTSVRGCREGCLHHWFTAGENLKKAHKWQKGGKLSWTHWTQCPKLQMTSVATAFHRVLCGGASTPKKRNKISLRQSSDRAKATGLIAFKTFKEEQLEDHQQFALTPGAPGGNLPAYIES